jgi:DNA repair protein RecN (Recombination protein N)
MLSKLVVENYALISSLDIDFRKGLTIITGETGAGKSILLGALSLILGKRADTSILQDKSGKCLVEGSFDLAAYGLDPFFTANDMDYEAETIIRREIQPSGKSRAFINDTPVTLEILSEFGKKLIDIHSQHQNLDLANSVFQMMAIDNYAGNQEKLTRYREQYRAHHDLENRYHRMCGEAERMKAEQDYLLFQYAQLEEAHMKSGEEEELETEQERLAHAEEIKAGLSAAVSLLEGDQLPATYQVKECIGLISKIHRYLPQGESLLNRLESLYIELKDLSHELSQLNDQHDPEPDTLMRVNDRLALLYGLLKKHNVKTVDDLLVLQENMHNQLGETEAIDFNLAEMTRELEKSSRMLKELAENLRQRRKEVLPEFEKRITGLLHEVGIPHARFTVQMEDLSDYTEFGSDRLRFLFSSNKNVPAQDISRVASGGELSRLMLCIKSLLVDVTGLPTLIFDEIDTGISGEIAERVGNIISRMAEKMQIINITHLPQVASKGQHHYLVYKTEDSQKTITRMKLLTPEERHLEIAKMLSGEMVTSAALENAKALLGN